MGNRSTLQNGTADQYREELEEEMAMAAHCGDDEGTTWGLGFDGYMALLTDEAKRIEKHE